MPRRSEDVRAIGRQLQVGTVLEGSLRRSGSRLRITVQLIDVATGFERWTERYDRALTDVFDVQDEIARSIVDALRLRLLTPEAPLVESRTNDFAEATARLGAIVEGDPRFGMAHYFLGCARREVGDDAAALAHLRDAAGLMGESAEVTAASAVTLVRLDEPRAREALASLEQQARAGYVSPVLLAQVHTALGEHERALDALDAARRVRASDLAWIAVRPVFDPLRGESRFARLLDGMGLSAVARG